MIKQGLDGLKLTEWDSTDTIPALALGVYIRHQNFMYIVDTANYAILGSTAAGKNYIKLSGTGTTITATWTQSKTGFAYDQGKAGVYDSGGDQLVQEYVHLDTGVYTNYVWDQGRMFPINITAGTGLTGGGDLDTDRTIAITAQIISQSLLKTSTHEQSTATTGSWTEKVLTYADYGFNCRVKYVGADHGIFRRTEDTFITSATYVGESIKLFALTSGTMYAIYRYVASSGEVFWVWLLRDKETGKITDADCVLIIAGGHGRSQ